MSGSDSIPATPDSVSDGTRELSMQASPFSEDSSVAGTPNGDELGDSPKRLPSLNTFVDPRNMNPSSTALGILGKARHPSQTSSSFAGGTGAMENSVMAKARALHQQRMQKGMAAAAAAAGSSPVSQMPLPGGPGAPGFPNLHMSPAMQRPGAVPHPRSAPVLPKPSLSERRANMGMGMKLSDISGSGSGSPTGGLRRAGAPSLAGMTGNGQSNAPNGKSSMGSKLDDFKKYIDAEKGWITFDGAATITRTGVNFSNGQTFSISLDEVKIIEELGKGNYGTVYKVKHAKPTAPRFGQGLSGAKLAPHPQRSQSDSAVPDALSALDGRTGKVMAMKEIRLELDDAKFTTILKELVILHECVSPFIIDFYGAFFQEGAVYMCIEYMDGGSIDKIYAGGIPENVLRKITYSAIMGLKSLKDEHNIIHRDVKPTNILANTRGQIKICDFGVSGNLVASIAKTNIGCQSYMAPERISGGGMAQPGSADGTYSVQSDVWSLGLTVIECAMGRYPYPPEASSTIFSQLNAIVEGEPPGMPETGYSDMAKDFVKNCLHKIAKMRPTYALLLKHPWIKTLSKPETITEVAEDDEAAEKVAEAVGHIDLNSGTEDVEVAEWVQSVLKKNAERQNGDGPSKPALHAAPLDSISPLGSPIITQDR
ncbi:kinase-like domain-containing protein [Trichoderma ceciliae]